MADRDLKPENIENDPNRFGRPFDALDAATARIERVLNDRKGFHVDGLDEETRSDLLFAIVVAAQLESTQPQIRVKLDVASVETNGDPHKVELRLDVVRAGARYLIGVADDHSAHIDGIENGFIIAIDTNTGIGRELIGYALRRAICRGISKSEVTETRSKINGVDTNVVRIDLGVLK